LRKGFDTVAQALAALGPQQLLPGRKLLTAQVDAQRIADGSEGTVDGEGVDEEALELENGSGSGSAPRVPGAPRDRGYDSIFDRRLRSPIRVR
jgi:hypothetical protein